MSAKSVLGYIRNDKGRNAFEFFKRFDGFAEIFLFQKVDVVLKVLFENAEQGSLDAHRRFAGLGQRFPNLRQFVRSRHPNFIPIAIVFLQFGQRLVSRLKRRVLQAAPVQHVFEHGSIGRRFLIVVLLFADLVQFIDQVVSFFSRHAQR